VLDHLSIQCADLAASAAFYDAVLAPLGGQRILDFGEAIGYGVPPQPDFGSAARPPVRASGNPTSPSPHQAGPPCGPSSTPLWRRAPRSCTSRGCGRNTTPPITGHSSATLMATTSRAIEDYQIGEPLSCGSRPPAGGVVVERYGGDHAGRLRVFRGQVGGAFLLPGDVVAVRLGIHVQIKAADGFGERAE